MLTFQKATEARGVSITQLDSIDPTLVVYRAEATFVGVGLWDLYGAVVSPGARVHWDRQHEDGVLLEDVNELTELWHFKTKPAWPVKYVHCKNQLVMQTNSYVYPAVAIRSSSRRCTSHPQLSMCSYFQLMILIFSHTSQLRSPMSFEPKSICKDGRSSLCHRRLHYLPSSNNPIQRDGRTRHRFRRR